MIKKTLVAFLLLGSAAFAQSPSYQIPRSHSHLFGSTCVQQPQYYYGNRYGVPQVINKTVIVIVHPAAPRPVPVLSYSQAIGGGVTVITNPYYTP